MIIVHPPSPPIPPPPPSSLGCGQLADLCRHSFLSFYCYIKTRGSGTRYKQWVTLTPERNPDRTVDQGSRFWNLKSYTIKFKLSKRPVIIYHLGGEGGDFRGDHLILGSTKGEISRNWEPRRGRSLKVLEGFRGKTTQICLENEDIGEGGSRKSSTVIRGITSVKKHSKGGSDKFHLV